MLKVVIDTNVFISSQISALGNPGKIINLIANEKIELYYSTDILKEYQRVLSYAKFNFSIKKQTLAALDIKAIGELVKVVVTNSIFLPDESDRIFYDTAKTANTYLITGNKKHFPDEDFIMTPTEFLQTFFNVKKI